MATLCLKILDVNNNIVCLSSGENEVNLACSREYTEGDRIVLESSDKNVHLWLQLDDALGKSLVYVTDFLSYKIPFGEKRANLSPKVFHGGIHLLSVKMVKDYEIKAYRNLAVNVNDQHGEPGCYPHASANVETRGEAVFAAKNAIDGVTLNLSHGSWPYQSWGINQQNDAAIKIDFGRQVAVDRIILYTRADFPHDNWWKKATFTFSDGSDMEVEMNKSSLPHEFTFERKEIRWVEMSHLIKSPEESPFPALTQIEVYGTEI
ncbi:MAG TPA: carbohydrate-binding protein [Mobilitalea sp.]|nr:carbohydrate-binding protein [Mobilitalea sp.]